MRSDRLGNTAKTLEVIQIAWDPVEDWEDGVVEPRESDEDRLETGTLAYTDLSEGLLTGQETNGDVPFVQGPLGDS